MSDPLHIEPTMNYLSFFDLNQEPFSNTPVSRFYYGSQQHSRALMRLNHAVETMKGLAVVIGETGAGKTTTARRLLESLPEDRYEVALLVMVQSGVSPLWLLTKIAFQLGVQQPADDKTRLLGQLYRRLYAIHESGRRAIVLVDEAQMLNSRELMEEIRGLLNMEIPDQKLLTLVFFGLPELESYLKLDPPLYQRVAVRCRLESFAPETTEAYIKHRLKLAGATRMLFTQEAVQSIHRSSSGIPRLINTICDNALFEGFLSRSNPITAKIVESAVAELGYDGITERGGYRPEPTSPWSAYDDESPARSGRAGGPDSAVPAAAASLTNAAVDTRTISSSRPSIRSTARAEPLPPNTHITEVKGAVTDRLGVETNARGEEISHIVQVLEDK